MTEIVAPRTPEEKSLQQVNNNNKEDTPPGQHISQGYDPSIGLYYYHDGINPTLYMDPRGGQWCFWNNEGQFWCPVDERTAAAAQSATSAAAASATNGEEEGASASLGPPVQRTMMGGNGNSQYYDPYYYQQQQQYQPRHHHAQSNGSGYNNKRATVTTTTTTAASAAKASVASSSSAASVVDEKKQQAAVEQHQQQQQQLEQMMEVTRPLPFRLTSASQSQRERISATQSHHQQQPQVRKRLDWATAFGDLGPDRGSYASRFAGAPAYLSNPPLLPLRFYYPHVIRGSYYDFLNVRPTASLEEVEESVQWWETIGYPRASAADPERAERVHRLVMEAAIIISNPSLRAQYDQTLPLPGTASLSADHNSGNKDGGGKPTSLYKRGPDGLLDVSTHVPRVVHLHNDDGARTRGTNSATGSRVTSVTNTPSKYPGNAAVGTIGSKQGYGGAAAEEEEEDVGPTIAERLFAAVSEGIFGPPRARPRSRKSVERGAEWLEVARRALEEGGGDANGAGSSSSSNNANSGGFFNPVTSSSSSSTPVDVATSRKGNGAAAAGNNGSSKSLSDSVDYPAAPSSGAESSSGGVSRGTVTPMDGSKGPAGHAGAYGASPNAMSPPPVGPPLK